MAEHEINCSIGKLHLWWCMVFILLTSSSFSQPNDTLTLKQIVQKVRENSHTLRRLESQIDAAGARIDQAKTAYRPQLNADISYANIGPKDNLELTFGTQSLQLAPSNSFDAHLSAGIMVYDFGKRAAAVNVATVTENSLTNQKTGLENKLLFHAVSLAVNITMLQQGIGIQKANIASLERHLANVGKLVATGTATDYDILKTKAQLASAQAGLLDIENNKAKLRIFLAQIMGVALDSFPAVTIPFDTTAYRVNADSLVTVGLEQRIEIITATDAVTTLNARRAMAEKERMPELRAALAAGVKNGYAGDVNAARPNWSAAAQLHVPIYDGARTRYRLNECNAELKAANETLAESGDNVRTEILQAHADVETAYAKLASSALQVLVNDASLKLAQKKYEAGTLTNSELLDAERDYAQAELVNLQNQARYTLSIFTLAETVGNATIE
ncbi:MAG: TolC family protein [archaeon]